MFILLLGRGGGVFLGVLVRGVLFFAIWAGRGEGTFPCAARAVLLLGRGGGVLFPVWAGRGVGIFFLPFGRGGRGAGVYGIVFLLFGRAKEGARFFFCCLVGLLFCYGSLTYRPDWVGFGGPNNKKDQLEKKSGSHEGHRLTVCL